MADVIQALATRLQQRFEGLLSESKVARGEVTVEVPAAALRELCLALRDEPEFAFEQLIDLCGVDYLGYGEAEWETAGATATGFSRGVERLHGAVPAQGMWSKPRFAVVYHLLSLAHNQRLRVRAFAAGEPPRIDSVIDIWNSAGWYEREAFDLYGILFEGHPDLRRILTDYGFIGHPFRKDFPLTGNVEMRYDADKRRVVYEAVSIENRVLVPRVIRHDQARSAELEANGG